MGMDGPPHAISRHAYLHLQAIENCALTRNEPSSSQTGLCSLLLFTPLLLPTFLCSSFCLSLFVFIR